MARSSSVYVCQQCGYRSPQFLGRCPECGTWNSLVEQITDDRQQTTGKLKKTVKIIKLSEVEKQQFDRLSTGLEEFDRVLGGGIVPGSLVLVSGDPGIGKSTLLTQLALSTARGSIVRAAGPTAGAAGPSVSVRGPVGLFPRPMSSVISLPAGTRRGSPALATPRSSPPPLSSALYVAGEESAQQIKIRAERISPGADLAVLNETDVDIVVEAIGDNKGDGGNWGLVVVDSIQALETADLNSVAGSVGQVRECAHRLQRVAKSLHTPIFLVGHVTKEGTVAGPKTLEHLVDVVLSLEGESTSNFRILRSTKNRFGPTDEVGIFEMEETGMIEIKNPSRIFLETKVEAPGSTVVATLTGLRPILVEIQALVTKSFLPMPRRTGSGIDNNRLQLLTAVLQKRLGLPLFDQDIFVNVTGGLKVFEPAADLAICLAIASSLKDKAIAPKSVILGEVGLLGEVRGVRGLDKRIAEAKKLGFTKVISPENAKSLAQAVKLAITGGA